MSQRHGRMQDPAVIRDHHLQQPPPQPVAITALSSASSGGGSGVSGPASQLMPPMPSGLSTASASSLSSSSLPRTHPIAGAGGYTLPLVSALVEKLTCCLCHLLLRNPYQLGCGDRICESCLQHLLKNSSRPKCPVDGEPFSSNECFKDVFARREILALLTRCPSQMKRDSCPWIGKVSDVEEHEAGCMYCDIKCTNELCNARVERTRLVEHLEKECPFRPVICQYCNTTVLANDLLTHQRQECAATPLPCPNNCSAPKMLRKMFKEHLAKCPLQVVGCYYAFAGCTFRGPRKDLPEHHNANMAYHLQLCSQGLQTVQTELASVKKLNQAVTEQCSSLETTVKKLSEQFEKFSTDKETEQAKSAETSIASSASSNEGMEKNVDFLMQQQRVTDRSMAALDVQLNEINMRCDLLEVKTCNGILVWKIADFTQRRREAINSQTPSLYSPPFYTSPCGYKMCARLYPNGDGQGGSTHLSIFFVVMRGEFDALLPWPFQQRVTIRLVDQSNPGAPENMRADIVETFKPDPTSSSFHRPVKAMNVATGCPVFMPLDDLLSSEKRYIRDDTLFIKVVVHPVGAKAPDFSQK